MRKSFICKRLQVRVKVINVKEAFLRLLILKLLTLRLSYDITITEKVVLKKILP